jgi:hypothetical protein
VDAPAEIMIPTQDDHGHGTNRQGPANHAFLPALTFTGSNLTSPSGVLGLAASSSCPSSRWLIFSLPMLGLARCWRKRPQ